MMLDVLNPRLRRLKSAYRNVFETPDGALVLADLMRFAGVGKAYMPGSNFTSEDVLVAEGMRRTALRIPGMLEMDASEIARRAVTASIDNPPGDEP